MWLTLADAKRFIICENSIFFKHQDINLVKQIASRSLALVAIITTLDRKENLERFQLGLVNIVELSELGRLCVELLHASVVFCRGMSPELVFLRRIPPCYWRTDAPAN